MCKGTACIAEKRHVIDAVVTVNVTEHQLLEIPICMLHGDTRKGAFPTNVKATVQYGENLQALSVALNTVGAVSVKRTHEILSGGFNIPIATGTISNMVKRRADAVSETVNRIKQKIIESGLGYFDETGTRVDKKLWWVHDTSNSELTYLDISPRPIPIHNICQNNNSIHIRLPVWIPNCLKPNHWNDISGNIYPAYFIHNPVSSGIILIQLHHLLCYLHLTELLIY